MKSKFVLLIMLATTPMCLNAQFWKTSNPEKLAGAVNSEAEESIPVFSKDSSFLYFVRTFDTANKGNENDQDIWVCEKSEEGGYANPKQVKELNNKFNNAVLGLNSTGTRMYVLNAYDGKKDQIKGIAVSENKGGSWSTPVHLEIPGLDIDGDFYGFHVNEKEDIIIISYKGPGTLGEEDLYYSQKNGAVWSAPVSMGSTLNTKGYEISPFLSKSQDTLYFSSNGHGGQGDADIFYSVKQGSWSSWSTPKNLGNVINSPKFDAYFIHSGSQAYWSTNRESERSDIWMLNILTPMPLVIACSAVDATVYEGKDGSVSVSIESGEEPYTYAWSNGDNTKDIYGLSKGEYTVTVTDAAGQTAQATCFVDEPVLPIDPIVVTTYPNFEFKHHFGYNKNKLTMSNNELKKFAKDIVDQLEDGRTNITIKIHSSASNVPTKSYGTNEKLASVRAENMKYDLIEYFTKKGVVAKVNVVIAVTEVQGPPYEGDSSNRDKYTPFQFVSLKTE